MINSACYRIISELSAILNEKQVIDIAVNLSPGFLSELNIELDDLGRALLLINSGDQDQATLKVAAAKNLFFQKDCVELSEMGGLFTRTMGGRQPVEYRDFHDDQELASLFKLINFTALYIYPLAIASVTTGFFFFAHLKPDFFNPQSCELLDIVCRQTAIALQNARLFWELEQREREWIQNQEEWQTKLAHRLHDGPTQAAAAIAMRVNFARRLMETNPQAALEELDKLEDLARETTREIRKIAKVLHAESIEPS